MRRLAAFLTLVLLAGCLDPDDGGAGNSSAAACSLLGGPHDVPGSASNEAGTGARRIVITNVPNGDAIAVWWSEGEQLMVLHLRSAEATSGGPISINPAAAKVPNDVAVRIVAGNDDWTQDGFVAAGTGEALVNMAEPLITGSIQDTWGEPVSFGATTATWQPTTLPWADEHTMARLEALRLELAWDNGAGGGADFGIAVGPTPSGGFHYVNGQYQTTPGGQRETRELGPGDFAQLGWTNATRPQVGPSVSTGAFATTGIGYDLSWTATLGPDPELANVCTTLGDVEAVLAGSD